MICILIISSGKLLGIDKIQPQSDNYFPNNTSYFSKHAVVMNSNRIKRFVKWVYSPEQWPCIDDQRLELCYLPRPGSMWPSVVRRINICMTLVCVPGPGWSHDTCWMFSSSSQVTRIRWKTRVRISMQNSSGYLNHLQIFLSLFFIFSWTHFLYFPVSHLKSPAHTWENNPSDSPTQESYFRPLLHSSLRNAEQTQKSKHWKWVKIHLNP